METKKVAFNKDFKTLIAPWLMLAVIWALAIIKSKYQLMYTNTDIGEGDMWGFVVMMRGILFEYSIPLFSIPVSILLSLIATVSKTETTFRKINRIIFWIMILNIALFIPVLLSKLI